MCHVYFGMRVRSPIFTYEKNWELKFGECMLPFTSESFVFPLLSKNN
jgi:hypothetical protein